jgi:hypothetical protein
MLLRRFGAYFEAGGDIPIPAPVENQLCDLAFAWRQPIALSERFHVRTDFSDGNSEYTVAHEQGVQVERLATVCRQKAHDRLSSLGRPHQETGEMISEQHDELNVVPMPKAGDESQGGRVVIVEPTVPEYEHRETQLVDDRPMNRRG